MLKIIKFLWKALLFLNITSWLFGLCDNKYKINY